MPSLSSTNATAPRCGRFSCGLLCGEVECVRWRCRWRSRAASWFARLRVKCGNSAHTVNVVTQQARMLAQEANLRFSSASSSCCSSSSWSESDRESSTSAAMATGRSRRIKPVASLNVGLWRVVGSSSADLWRAVVSVAALLLRTSSTAPPCVVESA